MMKNQMFDQMDMAAQERLSGRDPLEIAQNCGAAYDVQKQEFRLSTMGIDLRISWQDCRMVPEIAGWHRLVILHYLDLGDGYPVTGKEMPFGQMKAGMVRGGGIDRKCEQVIQSLKNLDEAALAKICESMGGEKIPTNADAAYRIPFLPNFPVTLKVWLPDEDFPASGRLLVDESADHYLTIEDAVTVAELLLEKITKQSYAM